MKIVYLDDEIAVCVKDPGVLSEGNGLPEMLAREVGGGFFCVHRLDREVGGLMVLARNARSAAALTKAMTEGKVRKEYLAVAEGKTDTREGEMRDLLFHDRNRNKTFVTDRKRKGVREAVLTWRLLAANDETPSFPVPLGLYLVRLETGRTHQIRVQFASRKMPLAGDRTYGSSLKGPVGLFSWRLSFPHPVTGENMDFRELPEASLFFDLMKNHFPAIG